MCFFSHHPAGTRDSDPERSASSPLQRCLVTRSPLVSHPRPGSSQSCSSVNIPATTTLCEPTFGQLSPLTPHSVLPPSNKQFGHEIRENLPKEASEGPTSDPFLESDHGLTTLAFPSTTWSSCPSPQRTTPQSGSGLGLTPSAPVARLESHHWPVLPPISPVRGEK